MPAFGGLDQAVPAPEAIAQTEMAVYILWPGQAAERGQLLDVAGIISTNGLHSSGQMDIGSDDDINFVIDATNNSSLTANFELFNGVGDSLFSISEEGYFKLASNTAIGASPSSFYKLKVEADATTKYAGHFMSKNNSDTAYGVYGCAGGNGGSINYGVYGIATGADTNWAGYFNGSLRVVGYAALGAAIPTARVHIGHTGLVDTLRIDDQGDDPTPFVIDNDGNVTIGAASGSAKIHFIHAGNGDTFRVDDDSGDSTPFVIDVDGNVGIGTNSPTRKLFVNGDSGGTTAWYNDSDARLKKNINTIENALQKVQCLHGVEFEWVNTENHPKGKQIGFIGQETKEVVPEVVDIKDEAYSMQYAPLTALLVEAVKEQQNQIETLQKEIKTLKDQLQATKRYKGIN